MANPIFISAYGPVDIAMPIEVDGEYFGTILVGQVVLKDEHGTSHLEKIADSSHVQLSDDFQQRLKSYYEELPVMTMEPFRSCQHDIQVAIIY